MQQQWISMLALLLVSLQAYGDTDIPYPGDYRSWSHVKSLTLHDGHPLATPFKGIHHIYANALAEKGLQTGQYADGSMLVFDLMESVTAGEASAEGKRKLLAVMVKNRRSYPHTGGWGFEAWRGDSRDQRLTQDGGSSCFSCHTAQKDSDYVFSQWRY